MQPIFKTKPFNLKLKLGRALSFRNFFVIGGSILLFYNMGEFGLSLMTRHILLIWSVLFAASAHAAEFLQDDWQGGEVPGSTTSIGSGWTAYDSQDGNIVILSTGIQIKQNMARSWLQTDDSAGESGFNRAGSVFSSAAVSGSGAGAFLHMVVEVTVTVKATTLPEGRGDAAAVYDPVSGNIFVLGGATVAAVRASSDVFRYSPVTGSLSVKRNALEWDRAGMAAGYIPGAKKIFMVGGVDMISGGSSNLCQAWDPLFEEQIWSQCDGYPSPPCGGYGTGAYFPGDGKFYVFGGNFCFSDGLSDVIFAEDPVAGSAEIKTVALPSPRWRITSAYSPQTNKIYVFGGSNGSGTDLAEIIEYDPVADSTRAMSAALPSPRQNSAAVYYPPTGKILIFGGIRKDFGPLDDIVEFDPVADTATVRPVRLPSPRGGMAAAYDERSGRVYIFGASSGSVSDFNQILAYRAISSGTYISSVFDTGNLSSLGAISWNPAAQSPPSVSLGIGFRAGNTPIPDGTWSNGGKFTAASNNGSLSSFSPARYVQYSATFTTTNISTAAVLADITITYAQTAASAALVSSAFDTGAASSKPKKIIWQGTFPSGTTAQFQLRTAPDNGSGFPGAWTQWLGPTGPGDYYTSPEGNEPINPQHQDLANDRWLQYLAVLRSSQTFATPTVATVSVTYAFIPSAPTLTVLTADSSTQLSAQWTDNAVNEDEFVISSGTASGPANTGAGAASTDKPGSGGTQSAAIPNLGPNMRYYVRLRAHVLPPDNLFSPYSNELSAFTLASLPANVAVAAVSVSSLTLGWGAGGNPPNTPYELSLSTDGFTTAFSTPVPFAANLTATATTFFSLSPGTTYYLRVRARNGGGKETAFSDIISTQTIPAAITGLAGSALGASSITWNWNSSGPTSRYRVYSASSSVLLAEMAAPGYVRTGLSTNTASGLRVEPFNASGSAGLSQPATTYTQAASPIGLQMDGVGPTAVALSWTINTNPIGTRYEVSASTDGFAANFSTPVPLAAGLTVPATFLLGLDVGTTYYFRVRAANGDSVPTIFANIASTQTLPGTVSGLTGTALGVSSISWSWTNTAGPTVVSYDVFRASSGASLGNVVLPTVMDTVLATNTAYGIRIAARNATGAGALSPPATAFTLATTATGTTITAVHFTSVTLSWLLNTNPAGTMFEIKRSTDDSAFTLAASVAGDTHTVAGLAGPATYYFRVRALNGDGVPAGYDASVSTFVPGLPPLPPSGLSAAPMGGGRIRLDWSLSPSTDVVRYNLYFDNGAGTVDYSVTFSSLAGSTTSFTTPPLGSGVAYRFGLRAQDEEGQEEKNASVEASAVALDSLSGVRAAVRTPAAGLRLAGDSVTVLAEIILGKPSQVRQVLFQYKASSASAWQDIIPAGLQPNPDMASPFCVHWNVVGLTPANYDLRVVATGSSGMPDSAPPSVAVTVDPAGFDLREFNLGGGRIQKDQRVYDTISNMVDSACGDAVCLTRVALPAGALDASTATLTIVNNPVGAPAPSNGLRGTGIVAEISLSNGQTALNAGKTAVLTFGYGDDNLDGIVDGTLARADELSIYAYDAGSGQWKRESDTLVDMESKTLTGHTPHLSFFAVFVPAHADLRGLRVYPNPYKPNSVGADNGVPFNATDLNSGVIFDHLPDEVTVRVYTVSGRLVRELGTATTSGRIRWDVKNSNGFDVATGVYLAVIASPGQKAVIKKVAIIR